MNVWFTSDQHFGHKAIIKLGQRPFKDVKEMDETMVTNWNKVIKSEDTVYVLGDFIHKSNHSIEYYAKQLNGHKHLIIGNHDHDLAEYKKYFETGQQIIYLNINEQEIVLFHYPILSWKRKGRGAWHLYGHVHNAIMEPMETQKAYNVGVDVNNFTPISFEQLKPIMDSRNAQISDKADHWHSPKSTQGKT